MDTEHVALRSLATKWRASANSIEDFAARYTVFRLAEELETVLATSSDGWRLVPVKPTPNMAAEWIARCPDDSCRYAASIDDAMRWASESWAAMLAVAPTPGTYPDSAINKEDEGND